MDEYLDEEVEIVKVVLDKICSKWEQQVCEHFLSFEVVTHETFKSGVDGPLPSLSATSSADEPTRFLGASNPAAVKRNVLASFTDILLLPVTIVPRTVGAVGGAIGGAFRSGISGTGNRASVATSNSTKWNDNEVGAEYTKAGYIEGETMFSVADDDDDDEANEKGLPSYVQVARVCDNIL